MRVFSSHPSCSASRSSWTGSTRWLILLMLQYDVADVADVVYDVADVVYDVADVDADADHHALRPAHPGQDQQGG